LQIRNSKKGQGLPGFFLCQPSRHPLIDYAIGEHESKEVWESNIDEIQAIVYRGDTGTLLE